MTDFNNNHQQNSVAPPVEIPVEMISKEALDAILESFVLREGTDYGAQEVALETKLGHVRKQLERGDVKIVFDPNTESVTLMTKRDWAKAQSSKFTAKD